MGRYAEGTKVPVSQSRDEITAQPDTNAIQAAVQSERKRCAEIARDFLAGDELEYLQMVNRIAKAIEAGEQ